MVMYIEVIYHHDNYSSATGFVLTMASTTSVTEAVYIIVT